MAPSDPSAVTVTIFGKTYTIALEPGRTAAEVRQIAELVDSRMRAAKQTFNSPSLQQIAVLAGLNLVDELFQLQSDFQATQNDIAQRTSRLSTSLGRWFEENRIDTPGSGQS